MDKLAPELPLSVSESLDDTKLALTSGIIWYGPQEITNSAFLPLPVNHTYLLGHVLSVHACA